MLRRQVSNSRMRTLQLGVEGEISAPENVPVSPTDTNLSPCSKQLWGTRRASHTDVRLAHKPRQWNAETNDDATSSEDSDSESESDRGEITPVVEVKDDGDSAFFSTCSDLRVPETRCPTALPIVLGCESKSVRHVMDTLGWKHTLAAPRVDATAAASEQQSAHEQVVSAARAQASAVEGLVQMPAILITISQVVEKSTSDIRGVPASEEQAREWLRSYSDVSINTVTAVVATNTESGQQSAGVDTVRITWGTITDDVIDRVITRRTTLQTPGGISLEDAELKPLVLHVTGAVDSVWGLPVELLCDLIGQVA